MKIAKEFKFEMGHRLLFHKGKCKNLHGHSYKLLVEVDGKEDENGIVMDYYDLKSFIAPLVHKLDHSCLVYQKDQELYEALSKLNSKMVIVDFESTAENICKYFLDEIIKSKLPANISSVKIRLYETEETYAEKEISLM